MRSPSPRVLNLTADVYRLDPTRAGAFDADGGLVAPDGYPSSPDAAGLACGWNPDYGARVDDMVSRVGQLQTGMLLFAANPGVSVKDKFVLSTGETYYVDASADMAGRGAAWGVLVRNLI